jgi:hypothetical protein
MGHIRKKKAAQGDPPEHEQKKEERQRMPNISLLNCEGGA